MQAVTTRRASRLLSPSQPAFDRRLFPPLQPSRFGSSSSRANPSHKYSMHLCHTIPADDLLRLSSFVVYTQPGSNVGDVVSIRRCLLGHGPVGRAVLHHDTGVLLPSGAGVVPPQERAELYHSVFTNVRPDVFRLSSATCLGRSSSGSTTLRVWHCRCDGMWSGRRAVDGVTLVGSTLGWLLRTSRTRSTTSLRVRCVSWEDIGRVNHRDRA
jgi:hypothetical protein